MSIHTAKNVAMALGAVALLNFFSFVIVAMLIGGDAVNGRKDGERYYLCNHGRYTEVSRSIFEYSKIHTYSVWVTHPLAFLGGFVYLRAARKRAHSRSDG